MGNTAALRNAALAAKETAEIPPAAAPKRAARRSYIAPSRAGKRTVSLSLTPRDHRVIKQMALDDGVPMEALLRQAVNMLFASRGIPVID